MANKIEEIAERHSVNCVRRQVEEALRELLEECCKEVAAERQRFMELEAMAHACGDRAAELRHAIRVATCNDVLARLRALGGE